MRRRAAWVPAAAGTIVLAIPVAATYVAGILAIWNWGLSTFPLPLAVLMAGGLVIAPLQLVQDVLAVGGGAEKGDDEEG